MWKEWGQTPRWRKSGPISGLSEWGVRLPLILKELQRETDHWFWALEAISGENPVDPAQAGQIENMKQAWIEWGRHRGMI